MWGSNDEPTGHGIGKCRNKTIRTIIAYSAIGYDEGFEIEFTDGTKLEILPIAIQGHDARLKIKLKEKKTAIASSIQSLHGR